MALKYTARIPSGPYAYLEVAADTADELKEGVSELIEAGGYGAMLDVAQVNAVRALDAASATPEQTSAAAGAIREGLSNAPGLGNKAPAHGSSSGDPSCKHGARTLVTKPNWSAWMCPQPKEATDKCKPIDAKTGREWN